ncbi:MAG: hypothetical protein H8E37_13035 [Planctomycetes bacterium]|nr:hypothetical protein [Planctomycetota bacterium]
MSIEFTCLHCSHRMSVSDDRTGEKVACAQCQQMISVPVPIGGRLTEYRLKANQQSDEGRPEWPPPRPQPSDDELEEPLSESEAAFIELPPDPGMGFHTEVRLPKLLRRNERPAIEATAQQILEDVLVHLQNSPQDFRSGSLALEVDRFEVESDSVDARLRLFGTLNGERFTAAGQYVFDRTQFKRSLIVILTDLITKLFFWRAQSRRAHRAIRNTVRRQLCAGLDEAVGNSPGFLVRFGRFFSRPMGRRCHKGVAAKRVYSCPCELPPGEF